MDSDQVYVGRVNGPAQLYADGRRLGYGGAGTALDGDELRLAVAVAQHETGCLVVVHYDMGRNPAMINWHPRPRYALAPVVTFDPLRGGADVLRRAPFANELSAVNRWTGPAAPHWSTGWPLYALTRCLDTGYAAGLGCFSLGLNQIQLGVHIGAGRVATPTQPWTGAADFSKWWRLDSSVYDTVIHLAFGYLQACFRGPRGALPPYRRGEARSTTIERLIGQTGGGAGVAGRFLNELHIP